MPHSEFRCMLAKDAGDLTKVKFPLWVQPKLDGIRASVVNGKLVTRTLKPVPNEAIRAALERPEFEGFDGELIVGSPTASDCYRRTCSFVMAADKVDEPWSYHVFDLWNEITPFRLRSQNLSARLARTATRIDLAAIRGVAVRVAEDVAELEQFEQAAIAAGYEGVIARDPSGLYKFGRSGKYGPLLKIKRFVDFEAEVVGTYEEMHNANEAQTNALGRTERSSAQSGLVGKGTLGGLALRALNGPAEGVTFRCGTGFDAAQRAALWPLRDELVGQVAKIKSFPIGVLAKPRHPVWLGWRSPEDFEERVLTDISGWVSR